MLIVLTFHKTPHQFILVVHNDNIVLIESDEQEIARILDALVRYIWTRRQKIVTMNMMWQLLSGPGKAHISGMG